MQVSHLNNEAKNFSTLFQPTTKNTLIFDDKNEKLELFGDLYPSVLKLQHEISETIKDHHFLSHLRKEALQTFGIMNARNWGTLEDVVKDIRAWNQ